MFSGLDLNQEGEAPTNSSECRPWGSLGLSVPLSLALRVLYIFSYICVNTMIIFFPEELIIYVVFIHWMLMALW